MEITPEFKSVIAQEFQNAVIDVLTSKTKKVLMEYDIKNYGQLKEALKRGFRNASHQNRYGYPLQRWIVKKNTKNIVFIYNALLNFR